MTGLKLDDFAFPSVDALETELMHSALGHPDLSLGSQERFMADGRVPAVFNASGANLHAVTHELAHIIDFYRRGETDRFQAIGYGLRFPTVEVLGRSIAQPTTTRGLRRECRVFAIQAVLLRDILGRPVEPNAFLVDSARTIAASFTQLEDAYCIPHRRGITRWLRSRMGRYYLSRSVASYEQDRLEYALKYMVRGYLADTALDVLADYRSAIEMMAVRTGAAV